MQGIDIIEQNVADLSIDLLKTLLIDRTTGNYIKWATDNYEHLGIEFTPEHEILPELVTGENTNVVQPRVSKDKEEQNKRTKDKAEVFTPSWVCNAQNNLIDEAWFGNKDVFNTQTKKKWKTAKKKIGFPEGKTWQDYVDDKRLEITCGEAPYITSRYDTVTGKPIDVPDRIGLLDRKLRIINENCDDEDEWLKWAYRAFQSIYGYDYQGDNVLLARENLLCTFSDNMIFKLGHEPLVKQLNDVARIISWNIWQMDGLTYTVPYGEQIAKEPQMNIFDYLGMEGDVQKTEPIPCKIFDWRSNCSIEFRSMIKEAKG